LKHRPPIAPPVILARPHVEVRRVPPPATVFPCALLVGFRCKLATVIVDHDQMKTRSLE